MFRIIGTDRRYSFSRCYGEFKTLEDRLTHMNRLIVAFGNVIHFRCEEGDKK